MTNSITCPHCGALLAQGKAACDFCGSQIQVTRSTLQIPTPKADNFTAETAGVLPPEFSRLKRPKVSENPWSSIVGFIFGIPWTIFSFAFLVFILGTTLRDYQRYNQLSSEGVTTQAVVTTLEVDDSGDSTSYEVSYRFVTKTNGDSKIFEAHDSVPASIYNSLETGGKVAVIYVASDPQLSVIQAHFGSPSLIPFVLGGGMSLVFTLIGIAMLYAGFKAGMNLWQFSTKGKITQGIIFERWADTDSDGTNYYVAYAFPVYSNQTGDQMISNAQQSFQAFHKLKIGEKVNLKYLPDNPKTCQLVDFHW
jgi:hypothetical protein